MAYNTRRNGGGGGDRVFNNMNSGRGRGMGQNFVSGGQYQNNQKPGVQMGQQVTPQQRPQNQPFKQNQQPFSNPPFPSQQQQQPGNQQNAAASQQLRQAAQTLPPAPLKSALKKTEVKTEVPVTVDKNVQQPQVQVPVQQNLSPPDEAMVVQPAVPPTLDADAKTEDNGEVKKKTLIIKGKISKKEKRGRRNKRLRKMLMPKNALMILNELCAGHKFSFIEKDSQNPASPYYVDPDTYVASVTIDGTEHIGYAKSKIGAKTAAAENALRHIVLTKIGTQKSSVPSTPAESDSEGDGAKMEVDSEQPDEDEVSWLHVASFAMHKLFASWYADGEDKSEQAKFMANAGMGELTSQLRDAKAALASVAKATKQRRPAKQLPGNPQLLNPVMLLNQMRDDVTYEEVCKDGNPPNIMFTYRTIVDGWEFYGRGGNKKIARRNCAYAACTKLYELVYPAEEYDPTTTSCSPSDAKAVNNENNVQMLFADDEQSF